MSDLIKIAVDAMGGDGSPRKIRKFYKKFMTIILGSLN